VIGVFPVVMGRPILFRLAPLVFGIDMILYTKLLGGPFSGELLVCLRPEKENCSG
jgi:hypothetical protein